MNWPAPTFTDSGGFQVMSLGVGFKKMLAMNTDGLEDDDVIAEGKTSLRSSTRMARPHSHLDGSQHRFTRNLDADPAPAGRGHHLRLR